MTQRIGRIYVVDDDSVIADSMVQLLCAHGFQVDSGSCLADLIGALSRQPYDLIISDINMPGDDGFELLRVMSAQFPDRPPLGRRGSPGPP